MKTMNSIDAAIEDWQPPAPVRAASTTRSGGVSRGNWTSLNLALHVADDPADVARNRQLLAEALQLPSQPVWLNQVHGTVVAQLQGGEAGLEADAAFTRAPGVVCAVMTADCLPVLFADLEGRAVAAAHAGWRGLASGVIEATLGCFEDPARVSVWLGPAIGPHAFQVGAEVRDAFLGCDPAAAAAFEADLEGRWRADIYHLARQRLAAAGVRQISGGGRCTYTQPDSYYSYRRDGITGRMASLIWIDEETANE